MADNSNDPRRIEALRKTLRTKAKGQDTVPVLANDLLALLDEVGRLAQSNDRLRRQNKRMRIKGKGEPEAEDAPVNGSPAAESPTPDATT